MLTASTSSSVSPIYAAQTSAKLLPYQGIFLFLRRKRDQEQQHHAAEPQNQHHYQLMQHERQHTAGNDAERAQKYADTLRGLIPPLYLRQLRVGHFIIHSLSPQQQTLKYRQAYGSSVSSSVMRPSGEMLSSCIRLAVSL